MKKIISLIAAVAQIGLLAPVTMAVDETTVVYDYNYTNFSTYEAIKAYGITPNSTNSYTSFKNTDTVAKTTNVWWVGAAKGPDTAMVQKTLTTVNLGVNDTQNLLANANDDIISVELDYGFVAKGYSNNTSHYTLHLMGKDAQGTDVEVASYDMKKVKAAATTATGTFSNSGDTQSIVVGSSSVASQRTYLRFDLDMENKSYDAYYNQLELASGTASNTLLNIGNDIGFTAPNATSLTSLVVTMSGEGSSDSFDPIRIKVSVSPKQQKEPEPEDNVALRFGVISDFQYGRASQISGKTSYEYCGEKFKRAVTQLKAKAGGISKLDALLIVGDITHNSTAEEWKAFVADLKEVVPPTAHTKVMFLRGNHDAKPNLQQNFITYLADYGVTQSNNIYDVNGFKFITVSQDTQRPSDDASSYPYIHSPETISWLNNALNEADTETGKPVFVGMHPAATDTVYGSSKVVGMRGGKEYISSYWGTTELYDSLKSHPNAITFSGHSHWDIANERSIYQKDFTSLNTGAINNMEIEDCWDEAYQPKRFGSNENECTGYYIEVDKDNIVTTHRMDFYRNCEIKTPWVINVADKDNWSYTDARDNDSPYFPTNAKATISNITKTGAKVTFTQGVDDTTDVGHYDVAFVNTATNETEAIYTVSSYYWLGADTPKENYWNASGLREGTTYKAVITAYDSFYQPSSTTLESDPFTTLADTSQKNSIVNVAFTKDGICDNSTYANIHNVVPRTYGTTPISFNNDYKLYEASFERSAGTTTSKNFYKILFDNERRSLMSDSYSIDLLFSPSQNVNDNNIIGMAQSSGWDIEADSAGTVSAYLRHGSAWLSPKPASSLKIEPNKYYHLTITYDGANVKSYCNGTFLDTVPTTNPLTFFATPDANYGLVIGGDYVYSSTGDQSTAQNAFNGKIVFANVYNYALSAADVQDINNKYNARKNNPLLDELKNILDNTSLNPDDYAYGYKLLTDVNSSSSDITTFINRIAQTPPIFYSVANYSQLLTTGIANTSITNNTTEDAELILFIPQFKEDNILIGTDVQTVTIPAASTKTINKTISINPKTTNVNVLVWTPELAPITLINQ